MESTQQPNVQSDIHPDLKTRNIKRPTSVTLLVVGVLIITVLNIIRFILSIRYWGFLSSRLEVSPIYFVLSGFIWGLAGVSLIWGLWKAKNWAPRLMQAIALTYSLYYWLDQVFLSEHPVSGAPAGISAMLPGNWQFSVVVTVLSLAYIAWIMNRSKVKFYYGMNDVRVNQDQGTAVDHEESHS
jgi:hypothetical protein